MTKRLLILCFYIQQGFNKPGFVIYCKLFTEASMPSELRVIGSCAVLNLTLWQHCKRRATLVFT